MGSLKTIPATCRSTEPVAAPRLSFSADFLDKQSFTSINPKYKAEKKEKETVKEKFKNAEFEFLCSNFASATMLTADELFFEGKLLPFSQMHHCEKLNKISLKTDEKTEMGVDALKVNNIKEEPRMSWFLDEDPSPRPPKCTVLWKELLKLRKQRTSTLSPSSSTSSSSSSSSGSISYVDLTDEGQKGSAQKEKYLKKIKKGVERTRSASFRIRPMVNVPVCTQVKNNVNLPPQYPLKKGKLTERKI